jgi:hypothetical protein
MAKTAMAKCFRWLIADMIMVLKVRKIAFTGRTLKISFYFFSGKWRFRINPPAIVQFLKINSWIYDFMREYHTLKTG